MSDNTILVAVNAVWRRPRGGAAAAWVLPKWGMRATLLPALATIAAVGVVDWWEPLGEPGR